MIPSASMNGHTAISALIDDGYTLDGKVQARPPLHPEVQFRYRPALPSAVYAATRGMRATPEDELKADCKLILTHLVSWNVLDRQGEVAPLNDVSLRQLPHPVLQSILLHIQGYAVTEAEADEKNSV